MMKRAFAILLAAVLLLPLGPAPRQADAASAVEIWVSPTGKKTTDALGWYVSGGSYYLFLPGSLDVKTLKFGFTGVKKLTFTKEKKTVSAGDSADFLKAGDYAVTLDGKKKTLHVMKGSAGFPALFITTQSGTLDAIQKKKTVKEPGYLVFVGPDGKVQYDGALEHIKCRGNSSMTFVKKSYQIKLKTGASLMGMGKSKKWILTGNYRDKTLLRNQIVYDTALYMNMPYTPEHISAEVYINNEYQGLYLFSEKVMIDDDRVDIADLEEATEKLNSKALSKYAVSGSKTSVKGKYKAYKIPNEPEDLTGGYLVEFESYSVRYKQEASAYTTKKGNVLVMKSPEYASVNQMEYVSQKLQAFENAIFAKDGKDPDTGLHYTEIVDLSSLVHKYLIEEYSKNYDGNSSSQYFYKPADSVSPLFYAGPVWDYDSTFGSYAQEHNAAKVLSGQGLWIATASGGTLWWPALYKQKDFLAAVKKTWKAELKPAVEILLGKTKAPKNCPLRSLDEYAASVRDSVKMNDIRWPRRSNPSSVANTGTGLDKNITYIRKFLTDRYDFLCGEWGR